MFCPLPHICPLLLCASVYVVFKNVLIIVPDRGRADKTKWTRKNEPRRARLDMRFLHQCPYTNMQFLQKHERIPESPLAPHLPGFEVASASAWYAECRGSRRRSAQNATKTESREESFTNAASVYSGHARNQQLLVNLHLISAAGLETDVLPSNVRGVRREVGPLVMKRVAASGPTGSSVSGCCDTGRRHAAQLSLHQWDGRLKREKVLNSDVSPTIYARWLASILRPLLVCGGYCLM